jgi:hypothetical protein
VSSVPDVILRGDCTRAGCNALATGICSEGHSVKDCPNYRAAGLIVAESSENSDDSDELPSKDLVSLSRGELLTFDEVQRFLCWRSATLITIIGDRDSGKSTLLCSIYERFLRGPFANYHFCSSRTLIGFEIRAHYGRIESGRTEPETQRTPISEGLKYFHLGVSPVNNHQGRFDLLLSDRAGEVYRQARGNSTQIAPLVEFSISDHVVLLLDGARVANPEERSGAMQAVRQTLRAFLDGAALSSSSRVQVVMTKLDVFTTAPDHHSLLASMELFKVGILRDFRPRLKSLDFFEVAARDPLGHFDPAFGVDALFQAWLIDDIPAPSEVKPQVSVSTEFDRLLLRQEKENSL